MQRSSIVVQKYGGTSVATPEKLRTIADRAVAFQRRGTPLVLVVSAMAGQTDHLLELAREMAAEPDTRELDMLLSVGERITMALLSMAIRERGGSSKSLTGSQCGIITDTDHAHAHIVEVRPLRVFEALEEGHVVIVAGFQGVSTSKEITTLGRGGSDTTAVALAAALGAQSCDILSDVDGIKDADPRLVKDAAHIDAIASGEMLELGLSGARVLAPEAIDYARRKGITIHARSAFGSGSGTVVTQEPRPCSGRVRAVTSDTLVLPMLLRGCPSRETTQALLREGIAWKHIASQDNGLLLLADLRDVPNPQTLAQRVEGIATELGGSLVVQADWAVVTLVGEGIFEQGPAWSTAMEGLAQEGLALHGFWLTPFGVHLMVDRERCQAAVELLHALHPSP